MGSQNERRTRDDVQLDSPPSRSRARFVAEYTWLISKNVIGWVLILASFVAGPLVPGPGGIPLFLIGFALISFPGKRRLIARVLRGRPVRLRTRPFLLVSMAIALVMPALALMIARTRSRWLAEQYAHGALAVSLLYLTGAIFTSVLVWLSPRALNLLLRIVARARRKFRPWLRHHHIHLLPPRRRRRHPDEPGIGPMWRKDRILEFSKRRRRD